MDRTDTSEDVDVPQERARPRGGRPTRAAALERDERLLAIATSMFMDHGFEGTSMERVAEAACVGKATLYARYPDKAALFVDVLRRKILNIYGMLEAEVEESVAGSTLEASLAAVSRRTFDLSLTPESIALGRILSSEAYRFPELARLAVEESIDRQVNLVATIFVHFAGRRGYRIDDARLLADLFLSMVLGRVSRLKLFGIEVDREALDRRIETAISVFLHGALPRATN